VPLVEPPLDADAGDTPDADAGEADAGDAGDAVPGWGWIGLEDEEGPAAPENVPPPDEDAPRTSEDLPRPWDDAGMRPPE
jgi:hypothetical protein